MEKIKVAAAEKTVAKEEIPVVATPTPETPEPKAPEVKEEGIAQKLAAVDTPKKEESGTVSVDAKVLNKVLARLEKVEEDNEILRQAADVGRISRIEGMRAEGKLVKSAKVNFLDGQAVLGWAKVKDDVYFDQEGKLHETQIVKVVLEDETETEMDYRTFYRTITKQEGEVISENKDKDGNMNYVIQMKDGREYTLDVLFVN